MPTTTLAVRNAAEDGAPSLNQLVSQRESLDTKIVPFYEIIRRRRLELGLMQTEVAAKLGVKSSEFIGMLEKGGHVPGGRNLELNKVPRMADALRLNRKDLTRLALFEAAPMAAMVLFGNQMSLYQVRYSKFAAGEKQDASMTAEQIDVINKIYSLPSTVRATVLSTIEQFAGAYSTPRAAKGSMQPSQDS